MSTPNQLTATQAAAKIASGELSAVELMQACLARISEREADVQAWAFLDTERAMELAREADAVRAQYDGNSKSIGPLHGVPIGICLPACSQNVHPHFPKNQSAGSRAAPVPARAGVPTAASSTAAHASWISRRTASRSRPEVCVTPRFSVTLLT